MILGVLTFLAWILITSRNKIIDPSHPDFKKKFEIASILEKKDLKAVDFNFIPEKQLKVKLESGTEAIFSLTKDLESQVASLQFILRDAKIKNRQLKLVDLTGDNPYASF